MARFEIEHQGRRFEIEAPDQDAALRAIGMASQTPPRSVADTAMDVATQIPAGFNRGVDTLLNLPGDLLLRAPARALGLEQYVPARGKYATKFNPGGSLYFGSRTSDEPLTTPGRYAGAVGEALGASAVPAGAVTAAAPRLAAMAATTLPRAVGQSIGAQVAANPAAAAVADIAASTGAGLAQEGAKEAGFGPLGQTMAGIAGGVVPLAAAAGAGRVARSVEAARAGADPYARVAAGLGDMSIDDLTEAAAVGLSGTRTPYINSQAMRILGEEMVQAVDNPSPALRAAIERINSNQTLTPAVAQERIRELQRGAALQAARARLVAEGIPAPNATQVSPSAAQDRISELRRAQSESDLMLGEFPAVAGSNMSTRMRQVHNVADEDAAATTNPGTQNLIGYVANSGTMASSQGVRNAISERAANLSDHTRAVVQSLAPGGRTIQDVEGMLAGLQRQARAEYDLAHNGPVNYSVLHGLLQRYVERHLSRMYGRSGDQAAALREAIERLYVTRPAGLASREALPGLQDQLAQARWAVREARRQGRPREDIIELSRYADDIAEQLRIASRDAAPPTQQILMPSLQMAQDARAGIRGQIQAARQAGRNDIAAILQPLYDDVTRAMSRASPAWRTANQRWADMNLQQIAVELGEAFSKTAGPRYREQLRQFRALAPEAQDVVRVHFVQQLLDQIENAARLGGQQNLGRLFSRDHTRNAIRTILGDEEALTVARLVRDANVMARSRNELGGSQTHIRGQVQREQDADLSAVASATSFDWRNWKEAAFERLMAAMKERRNRVMGRVITTPMSDTPAVAEQIERMRRASDRVRAARTPPDRAFPLSGVWAPALNPLTGE